MQRCYPAPEQQLQTHPLTLGFSLHTTYSRPRLFTMRQASHSFLILARTFMPGLPKGENAGRGGPMPKTLNDQGRVVKGRRMVRAQVALCCGSGGPREHQQQQPPPGGGAGRATAVLHSTPLLRTCTHPSSECKRQEQRGHRRSTPFGFYALRRRRSEQCSVMQESVSSYCTTRDERAQGDAERAETVSGANSCCGFLKLYVSCYSLSSPSQES